MKVKLYNGDCLEVMKLIPNKSIDAIITDPPYGTTACKWDWIWKKDRTTGHLNAKKQPLRNIEKISVFYKKQTRYYPIMTIGKKSHSIGKAINEKKCKTNNLYGDFKRVNRKGNLKYPRQILDYKKPHPPIHPTQKPVTLIEYLIKTYTQEKETVLDFTMGSGTTGVACCNTNRDFIGIELDNDYFNIAKQRINNENRKS
jgi:site-specific DNA-methyltransferase (adenine-specific)